MRRTSRARLFALVLQLDDPRAPRGDQTVFGRDKEGVQQDENADRKELEEEGHAQAPRHRY